MEKKRNQKLQEQLTKKEKLKAETELQRAEAKVEPKQDIEIDNKSAEKAAASSSNVVVPDDQHMQVDGQIGTKSPEMTRRNRSRSPPPMDEIRKSYNAARRLDGLPPRPEATDEELRRCQQWFVGMVEVVEMATYEGEEVLMFDEKRLSIEERKMFDEAKDKALMVWIENAAWRAVDESEAGDGEIVPARFLQRWKKTPEGEKANARVIIQGFKHRDVLEQCLEKDSPTLSRTGRMLIYTLVVHKRWKLFSADVKSAFMQANSIDESTRIYVRPTSDMRRRLERLMGLKPHQLLKAVKPAFGDVRAPR